MACLRDSVEFQCLHTPVPVRLASLALVPCNMTLFQVFVLPSGCRQLTRSRVLLTGDRARVHCTPQKEVADDDSAVGGGGSRCEIVPRMFDWTREAGDWVNGKPAYAAQERLRSCQGRADGRVVICRSGCRPDDHRGDPLSQRGSRVDIIAFEMLTQKRSAQNAV